MFLFTTIIKDKKANRLFPVTLMFAQPLSGVLMSQAAGIPVSVFNLVDLPVIIDANKTLAGLFRNVHGTVWILLVVAVAGHVSAAVYHHSIRNDDVLRRMAPFTKKNFIQLMTSQPSTNESFIDAISMPWSLIKENIMQTENLTQFPSRFVSYPTNRLIAHFNSRDEVKNLLPELQQFGVDLGSVYILDSKDGLDALDVDGSAHGTLGMLSRGIHRAGSTKEREKFDSVTSHLSNGGLTIAVHASEKALRYKLIDLFRAHGGEEITYMAYLYIEDVQQVGL